MSDSDRAAMCRGTLTSGIDLEQVKAAREALAAMRETMPAPAPVMSSFPGPALAGSAGTSRDTRQNGSNKGFFDLMTDSDARGIRGRLSRGYRQPAGGSIRSLSVKDTNWSRD